MPKNLPEKKSPLKQPPPRQAGQSLHEFMEEQFSSEVFSTIATVLAFTIAAAAFWIAFLFKMPPLTMALVFTLLAVVALIVASLHIRKQRNEYRRRKQGRDGERTVGALLEELRKQGYHVFHDIPNAKNATFNIDHALVGPAGVFTIETKTFSKVGTRDEKIQYVNNQLTIPGLPAGIADDALHQANASADFLRGHLTKTTGQIVLVQPILVFPGWYVVEPPRAERTDQQLAVLNEQRIFNLIKNAPQRLETKDIALYAHRINMHINDCYT